MDLDRDQLESLSREALVDYIEVIYRSIQGTVETYARIRDMNYKNGRTGVATLNQSSKKAYGDVLARMRVYLRGLAIANHKE